MEPFDAQKCIDLLKAAAQELEPHEGLDSNTAQAGRSLRTAMSLLEPYTAAARAKWLAEDESE